MVFNTPHSHSPDVNTFSMRRQRFAFILLTLQHLLCTIQQSLACSTDQYYAPKVCVLKGVTAPYECKSCPANSMQLSPEFDKACVCNSGFYAPTSWFQCYEYKGNGGSENVIWPKVEDAFTCQACGASPGDWCTGGWHRYTGCFFVLFVRVNSSLCSLLPHLSPPPPPVMGEFLWLCVFWKFLVLPMA
jgi:hypothetical protein